MQQEFALKLCPKIILEGTKLTHKTDIAFKLNEHPRIVCLRKYRYHSPIISVEWCGFTNFPWGRGIINFEPQEKAMAMETYCTWIRLFELLKYYSWIIDRFHISTIVYQLKFGCYYYFKWLEERLLPLKFCIVLCTRAEESFIEAREERLKVSGNPKHYDNLNVFIDEQEKFRETTSQSILSNFELDVSNNDLDLTCNKVANWLVENDMLGFRE